MHRLIAEEAGHRAIANSMTHLTTEAPDLERLDSERRLRRRVGTLGAPHSGQEPKKYPVDSLQQDEMT